MMSSVHLYNRNIFPYFSIYNHSRWKKKNYKTHFIITHVYNSDAEIIRII